MSISPYIRPKEGDKCPACNAYDKPKGGILKRKSTGWTIRCHRYPECKYECVHKTSRKGRLGSKQKREIQFLASENLVSNEDAKLIRKYDSEVWKLDNQFKQAISDC